MDFIGVPLAEPNFHTNLLSLSPQLGLTHTFIPFGSSFEQYKSQPSQP